jgi:hypothetical protein
MDIVENLASRVSMSVTATHPECSQEKTRDSLQSHKRANETDAREVSKRARRFKPDLPLRLYVPSPSRNTSLN